MDFFKSSFFKDSLAFNEKLKTLPIVKTTFPELNYITENDVFWRELWRMMDEAKDYIWLMTYTFDDSVSANHTLKKLIEAQKRGVKVCLLLDDLNNRANKDLKAELSSIGGMVHSLNMIAPYWTEFRLSRGQFRRHHEKLFIADNESIMGSSNITDDYGGPVYGSFDFVDLNIIMKNVCLNQIRSFFGQIADYYNYNLDKDLPNKEIIGKYDGKYADSIFRIPKIDLIRTQPPHVEEIQDFILQKIYESKESIKIIQPYYYPIRKFEKALLSALKRGVSVELITTAKRDQPAYTNLKNILLLDELVKNGLKVYEINDKLLHMKFYQYDDKLYTAGSFNNDWFSWDINNELNMVVEGEKEVQKINEIFTMMRNRATPLDPTMKVGLYRYCKIKFWENSMAAGDWIFNKKRALQAERNYKKYRDFKQTLKQKNDEEAIEALKRLKGRKYRKIFMDWDDGLGDKV